MAKAKKGKKSPNAVLLGVIAMAMISVGAILGCFILNSAAQQAKKAMAAANETAKERKEAATDAETKHENLRAAVAGRDITPKDVTDRISDGSPNLFAYVDGLTAKIKSVETVRDDLKSQLENTRADLKRCVTTEENTRKTLTGQIADLRRDTEQRIKTLELQVEEREKTMRQLQDDKEKITKDLDKAKNEAIDKETKLRREIEIMGAKIRSIEEANKAKKKDAMTAIVDGTILDSDPARNFVVIDIGSRDGLRPGLRFNVYAPDKISEKEPPLRGKIQVVRVGETSSVADIVEISDRFQPFLKGDVLVNDLFSRGQQATFAIAGEFRKFSADQIRTVVTEYGGKIADTVDQNTDYVIVSDSYKGDAVDRAKQFGTTIITEEKFLALTGR